MTFPGQYDDHIYPHASLAIKKVDFHYKADLNHSCKAE